MKTIKTKILAMMAVVLIAGAGYMVGGAVATGPHPAAAYGQDVTYVYDAASPAVVEIAVTQQGSGVFGRSVQQGEGSGFLVDGLGHILTNNHVVEGATSLQVVTKNGSRLDARVIGTDPADDLAVVGVDPSAAGISGVTPLQFADSSLVKPGQIAVALGTPFQLNNTITVGIISGLNRTIGSGMTGMVQTDAAINPGNSGGPLLDANAQVVGINTAIEATSGARGIGFAVASNTATRALPALIAGQEVTRPWLGISGMALIPTVAQTLGISVSQGAYIVSVVPNSPAASAGLKAGGANTSGQPTAGGDVITAIDGKSVVSVEDLAGYLATKQVGNNVDLTVVRGGQTMHVTVTLGARPATVAPNIIPQPQPQPSATPRFPRMPRNRGGN